MGIFTVTHILRLFVSESDAIGETNVELLRQVVGNHTIVHSRVRKHLILKIFLGVKCNLACLQLGKNSFIVFGINNNGYVLIIFRCSTNHRRTADVDIFYCIRKRNAGFGNSCFERIKIYRNDVDGIDIQLFKLRHVFGIGTHRQKPSMHDGMESFYSAVKTFGETRKVANTDNGKSCILQSFCRAARGNNFVVARNQSFTKFNNARFVRNTYQRSFFHN